MAFLGGIIIGFIGAMALVVYVVNRNETSNVPRTGPVIITRGGKKKPKFVSDEEIVKREKNEVPKDPLPHHYYGER